MARVNERVLGGGMGLAYAGRGPVLGSHPADPT